MILWKHVCILIGLAGALICCKEAEVPSEVAQGQLEFHVINSLAIPNHEVRIEVTSDQIITIRKDINRKAVKSRVLLSAEELSLIWRSVDLINWKRVSDDDDVLGLDGTSYLIRFGEQEYEVWAPEHDTEPRGLSGLLELKSLLWGTGKIPTEEQDVAPGR